MPVVVTGASGFLGQRAVLAFRRTSPQVRAYVRRADSAERLREMGVKVAVGRISDVERLAVVMTGAHTVCHLVGGLDLPDASAHEAVNLGSVRATLEAARSAGVVRFLFVSYPGAHPASANAYLRSKGLAESEVRASGLQYAIVRPTHAYGRGSAWLRAMTQQARGHPARVVGSGRQLLAPVYGNDVAAVLAAADDRSDRVEGVWGLEGPDRVTTDELVDILAGRRRTKIHLRPRTAVVLSRLAGRAISETALEVLAADSLVDAPDAAAHFGVALTSLREGLERSLDGASARASHR